LTHQSFSFQFLNHVQPANEFHSIISRTNKSKLEKRNGKKSDPENWSNESNVRARTLLRSNTQLLCVYIVQQCFVCCLGLSRVSLHTHTHVQERVVVNVPPVFFFQPTSFFLFHSFVRAGAAGAGAAAAALPGALPFPSRHPPVLVVPIELLCRIVRSAWLDITTGVTSFLGFVVC
jgi:hypothetical protein